MISRNAPLKRGQAPARRTPLQAGAPLTSRVGFRRGTPLAPVSAKRAAVLTAKGCRTTFLPSPPRPAVAAKIRAALVRRSGGVCEIQLAGCAGVAVDPSHRKKVGAGGRHGEAKTAHDVLSNVLHACRVCHDELHRRPAWAKTPGHGWMLNECQDPAAVPVLYRGVLSLLTDDGRVVPLGEVTP